MGGINLGSYSPNPISWIDPWGWNNVQTGEGRDHVTYRGMRNGKPYTGYASAPSSLGLTADQIISRRYGGDFSSFGGLPPESVYSGSGTSGKHTARGLEQHYYEQDIKQHGKQNVSNAQNPVGDKNPNKSSYQQHAANHLDGSKQTGARC